MEPDSKGFLLLNLYGGLLEVIQRSGALQIMFNEVATDEKNQKCLIALASKCSCCLTPDTENYGASVCIKVNWLRRLGITFHFHRTSSQIRTHMVTIS